MNKVIRLRQCSVTTILSGIEDSITRMDNYCTSFHCFVL